MRPGVDAHALTFRAVCGPSWRGPARPGDGWARPRAPPPALRPALRPLQFVPLGVCDQVAQAKGPDYVVKNASFCVPCEAFGGKFHYEKSCVLVHLAGAAAYAAYALGARPQLAIGASTSAAAAWSYAALWASFACLLCSALYHAYCPNVHTAALLRPLDYLGIYLVISVAAAADLALGLGGLADVAWQAPADYALAPSALWLYFLARRCATCPSESWKQYGGECGAMGRYTHVDGPHSALRAAGSFVLSLMWIVACASVRATLSPAAFAMWLSSRVVALLLVVGGMCLDNVCPMPDGSEWAVERCTCQSWGCVMSAHAWWHVVSFVALAVGSAGSEVAITLEL